MGIIKKIKKLDLNDDGYAETLKELLLKSYEKYKCRKYSKFEEGTCPFCEYCGIKNKDSACKYCEDYFNNIYHICGKYVLDLFGNRKKIRREIKKELKELYMEAKYDL